MRRFLIIVVWAAASLLLWWLLLSIAYTGIMRSAEHGIEWPDWLLKVFSFGLAFGGLITVPVVVASLGVKGKLPRTRVGNPRVAG